MERDLRGILKRPVLTLHNTPDGGNEVNHETAYRASVESWGCTANLAQAYVPGVGYCAFTSR